MNLNRLEVLRYLGYNHQIIDTHTENLLNECMQEVSELSKNHFVYNTYGIEKLNHTISLKNTTLSIPSKDLATHLSQSDWCTLIVVSLGLGVDKKINYYSKFNITKSLILDACASTAIEALCNEVENKIRIEASEQDYNITSRFSPGYGDLPLAFQKDFIAVLRAYPKIGLTVNESSLLLPRKSITAIIGWQKEVCAANVNKCKQCLKENCLYRKCGDNNE